jgi:hypothetical protein
MCEYEQNCGFFQYLREINPQVTSCLKQNPLQCIRYQEVGGYNQDIIAGIRQKRGIENLHDEGSLLTMEETEIVGRAHGY